MGYDYFMHYCRLEKDAKEKFRSMHRGACIRHIYSVGEKVGYWGLTKHIEEETFRIEFYNHKKNCEDFVDITVY